MILACSLFSEFFDRTGMTDSARNVQRTVGKLHLREDPLLGAGCRHAGEFVAGSGREAFASSCRRFIQSEEMGAAYQQIQIATNPASYPESVCARYPESVCMLRATV